MIKRIKDLINKSLLTVKAAVIHDDSRQKVMFFGLNVILCLVSFTMTIVNIFTREYTLMYSTLVFSLLCLLNIILLKTKILRQILYVGFTLEAIGLICFFFISGIPNGFSALWVCLIPSFALMFFGGKKGSVFCLAEFIIIIFLFWIPWGRGLLQYPYSDTFLLRFPFLYIAIYFLSLLVELIRSETKSKFLESEERYHYLYRHDALTGLYNRYGFNELMEKAYNSNDKSKISIIILDIDDFKLINDRYGHLAGDEVLKAISALPRTLLTKDSRLCRWGGEEFMIVINDESDPIKIAESIRVAVEQMVIKYNNQDLKVTVSLGGLHCL